jgi:hypothetical protein
MSNTTIPAVPPASPPKPAEQRPQPRPSLADRPAKPDYVIRNMSRDEAEKLVESTRG